MLCVLCASAHAAPQIRRAGLDQAAPARAETQQANLLPTALNIVGGVMQMTQERRALATECVPTSSDITLVNDLVRAYAMAGGVMTMPSEIPHCGDDASDAVFSRHLRDRTGQMCHRRFADAAADLIWGGFPRADVGCHCRGNATQECTGTNACRPGDQERKSNIYDIFGLIGFSDEDLLSGEATRVAAFRQKFERCAPEQVRARQQQLVANFAMGTVAQLGQRQDAATVQANTMELLMQGAAASPLGAIAPLAGMMLMGGMQ